MEKRVNFTDEGILQIANDNAKIVNGIVTSKIEGDYVIDGEDLMKLAAILEDKIVQIKYMRAFRGGISVHTNTEDCLKEIESFYEGLIEKCNKMIELACTTVDEIEKLIDEHNNNRYIFNRKIVMSEKFESTIQTIRTFSKLYNNF